MSELSFGSMIPQVMILSDKEEPDAGEAIYLLIDRIGRLARVEMKTLHGDAMISERQREVGDALIYLALYIGSEEVPLQMNPNLFKPLSDLQAIIIGDSSVDRSIVSVWIARLAHSAGDLANSYAYTLTTHDLDHKGKANAALSLISYLSLYCAAYDLSLEECAAMRLLELRVRKVID